MFRLFHLMWVFFSSSNFVPSFLVILFSVWVCSFCLATQHINTLFKTCTEQPFCNQIFWWLSDRQYTFCFHVNIQCANYFTTSSLYLIIVKSTGSISQNWERFRLFLFFPLSFLFFWGGGLYKKQNNNTIFYISSQIRFMTQLLTICFTKKKKFFQRENLLSLDANISTCTCYPKQSKEKQSEMRLLASSVFIHQNQKG